MTGYMEPDELLAELRRLQGDMPEPSQLPQISQDFLDWYGRLRALLVITNPRHGVTLNTQEIYFGQPLLRGGSIQQIRTLLTNEVQRLEIMLGPQIQPVYGPGAQYDFYRNLRAIIQSAEQEIFLIDNYIDRDALDLYCGDLPAIRARVLTHRYFNTLEPVLKLLSAKNEGIEVRDSEELHDRVIFIDQRECWVVGASFKDAADNKPTYIAPLPADVVEIKLDAYNGIWERADPAREN